MPAHSGCFKPSQEGFAFAVCQASCTSNCLLKFESIPWQNKEGNVEPVVIDLAKPLSRKDYEVIVQNALQTHEQDSEIYLDNVKARLDR